MPGVVHNNMPVTAPITIRGGMISERNIAGSFVR
jgi:hypothetical protein